MYINSRVEFRKSGRVVNPDIDAFKKKKIENFSKETDNNWNARVFKMQPAPLSQFKKYINDA